MGFKSLTDYLIASAQAHNSVNSTNGGHEFDFDVDGNDSDAHFFLEYNPTQKSVNGRAPTYALAFLLLVKMDQQDRKESTAQITIGADTFNMDERTVLGFTEQVAWEILRLWDQEENGFSIQDSVNAISLVNNGNSVRAGWRVEFSAILHRDFIDRCTLDTKFGSLPNSGL